MHTAKSLAPSGNLHFNNQGSCSCPSQQACWVWGREGKEPRKQQSVSQYAAPCMAGLQQDNNCQNKQVDLSQAYQGLHCCLSSLPYENENLARDRICNFKLHVVQLKYVAFAITRGGCRWHSATKVSHTHHESWDLLDRPQKYSLRQKGKQTIPGIKTQSLKSCFLLGCPF